MDELARRVLRFIRRERLLAACETVVVALSGGPDSVALTLLLADMAAGPLPLDLRLAHLNHALRGAQSDADEEFCRRLADRVGLPIAVDRATGLAATGRSPEADARRVRYAFLGRVARDAGATAIATAHHADDVAESVLMRLLRGAGVTGLGAVPPCRPLGPDAPGVRLARPLLDERKQELVRFLEARGESWREDRSNLDTDLTRNRIRHVLIPMLAREFPSFSVDSLRALNASACEVAALLSRLVEAAWSDLLVRAEPGAVCLDARVCAALAAPARKCAARRALAMLHGDDPAPALRAEHLERLAALPDGPVGAAVALPGGVLARREHGIVRFSRGEQTGTIDPRPLEPGGAVGLPAAGLRIECHPQPPGAVDAAAATRRATDNEVFVDRAALRLPLAVRPRRPGDRFRPLGAPGARRLKEFLIERAVPRHRRDLVPLVVDAADRIVWVVGHRIGHDVRLRPGTGEVLHMRAVPLPAD